MLRSLILIIVLAIIAGAGWLFYHQQHSCGKLTYYDKSGSKVLYQAGACH